jgi:hypothetical protein
MFTSMREGRFAMITTDVATLTGQPAGSFASFVSSLGDRRAVDGDATMSHPTGARSRPRDVLTRGMLTANGSPGEVGAVPRSADLHRDPGLPELALAARPQDLGLHAGGDPPWVGWVG